jgi:hypothetical protein
LGIGLASTKEEEGGPLVPVVHPGQSLKPLSYIGDLSVIVAIYASLSAVEKFSLPFTSEGKLRG